MMEKRVRFTVMSAVASAVAAAGVYQFMGIDALLRFGLVLLLIPVIVYLQFKERLFTCSPEVLMNESPTVVGMISVILTSNGSFDTAARDVAENGPKNFSKMFKGIVMDADCRAISDIGSGVKDMISSFPKELSPFRRAMQIILTAFESSDPSEREMMVHDAENIILTGLKEMGESYSSKLNTPCMLIFGLGVMVPMILISILPMLSIGGQFGTTVMDSDLIPVVTLVIVPMIVGGVILSMRGKNPFFQMSKNVKDLAVALPMLAAIPLMIINLNSGVAMDKAIVYSAVPAGIITLLLISPKMIKEAKRHRMEETLKDVLFELGNRLSMGENFEVALERGFSSRTDCKKLSESISRELRICRGNIEEAIHGILDEFSARMAGVYCDVYRASVKDIRDAGGLACNIAHQFQDQNGVRKNIENKLKNMLDMMTGTSAVFAPLILGMSVVMMEPLSGITGVAGMENVSLILTVYVIELAALISVLSSNLMSKGGITDVVCRFCAMMPLALMVFTLCSSIGL